jgi:hypothetical protein
VGVGSDIRIQLAWAICQVTRHSLKAHHCGPVWSHNPSHPIIHSSESSGFPAQTDTRSSIREGRRKQQEEYLRGRHEKVLRNTQQWKEKEQECVLG